MWNGETSLGLKGKDSINYEQKYCITFVAFILLVAQLPMSRPAAESTSLTLPAPASVSFDMAPKQARVGARQCLRRRTVSKRRGSPDLTDAD